jgi:hypothetical protein
MPDKPKTYPKPSHIKDLTLLFSIPMGIAILVAAFVYVPSLFANPQYDFIYSLCADYYACEGNYKVNISGHLDSDIEKNPKPSGYTTVSSPTLHYYTAANNSTRSLTIEEARRYKLNTSSRSPDGYNLTSQHSGGGFLFWGDYDSGWYLKNGVKKEKVDLTTASSAYYYNQNVNFLGWVEK